MIASTKLVRAQKAMEIGRVYGTATTNFLKLADVKKTDTIDNALIIACSSDRGLCGSIHSQVSKLCKSLATSSPNPSSAAFVVLGDKAKPQIAREWKKNIRFSVNQVGKSTPTFLDASSITALIIKRGLWTPTTAITIVYNKFKSVIAYEAQPFPIFSSSELLSAPNLVAYEYDDEVMINYAEFLFASSLYWAMVEGSAAEMAARRTAMENATKNAGEVIQALTMKYNRTRQAVITNELVDIITGASAL